MPMLDGLTGVVFGAVVGSLFVLTCVISVIKAIRDRSRIKKRRAVRKRIRLENGCTDGPKNSSIEVVPPAVCSTSQKIKPTCSSSNRLSNGTSDQDSLKERLDLSVYSIDAGVDNLNFQHSSTNIKCVDENQGFLQKSKAHIENVPSRQNQMPKRTKSHDPNFRRERNLDHLSAECLAIKKCMRRHSYEIAVCENSWLPKEPVYFAPSNNAVNAYRYGGNVQNGARTSKVAFENRAYDKNDYNNT